MSPFRFISASALACCFLAPFPQPSPSVLARDQPATPVRWQLTGADAQRVEELNKSIDQLRRAGKFAEAVVPAQGILATCERTLGPDHWQTADARRAITDLRRIVRLPEEGRKAIASVAALENQ